MVDFEKRRRKLDRRRGILTMDATGLPFSLDSKRYNMGRPAKCYMAAFRLAADLQNNGIAVDDFRIAQGSCLCRHKPSEWFNRRVMHGWVEWRLNGTWLVLDGSCPVQTNIAVRDVFYRAADINADDVWRYGAAEAIELVTKLEHYGPWRKPKAHADDWSELDEAKLNEEGLYVDD